VFEIVPKKMDEMIHSKKPGLLVLATYNFKILESIRFKILRFKRLPSSISFQKSKYQIKEFKIFDI
jgi:hypothetical protein